MRQQKWSSVVAGVLDGPAPRRGVGTGRWLMGNDAADLKFALNLCVLYKLLLPSEVLYFRKYFN